jgi:hypothetical protein
VHNSHCCWSCLEERLIKHRIQDRVPVKTSSRSAHIGSRPGFRRLLRAGDDRRLAQAERNLERGTPITGVIGVLSDRPGGGASSTSRFLASLLDAMSPGEVVLLDADTRAPFVTASDGAAGDLRGLLRAARVGHPRRLVDSYLDQSAVPRLSLAETDRAVELLSTEVEAAGAVLRPRFSTVIIDLPPTSSIELTTWLLDRADRIVLLLGDDSRPHTRLRDLLSQHGVSSRSTRISGLDPDYLNLVELATELVS